MPYHCGLSRLNCKVYARDVTFSEAVIQNCSTKIDVQFSQNSHNTFKKRIYRRWFSLNLERVIA